MTDVLMRRSDAPVDRDGRSLVCSTCGLTFADFKGRRVHETAHRGMPCRWCDALFSVRGINRHEAWCQSNMNSPLHKLLPVGDWRSRMSDWLQMAPTLPAGSFVMMAERVGPVCVSGPAVGRFLLEHLEFGCVVTLPAELVGPLVGRPLRERLDQHGFLRGKGQRGLEPTRDPMTDHDPAVIAAEASTEAARHRRSLDSMARNKVRQEIVATMMFLGHPIEEMAEMVGVEVERITGPRWTEVAPRVDTTDADVLRQHLAGLHARLDSLTDDLEVSLKLEAEGKRRQQPTVAGSA